MRVSTRYEYTYVPKGGDPDCKLRLLLLLFVVVEFDDMTLATMECELGDLALASFPG